MCIRDSGEPVEMDVQMSQNGDTTVAEVSYEVNDESGGAAQMTMISEDGDFDGDVYKRQEEALKQEREQAEKKWEEDTSKTVQNVTVEDIADVVSMSTGAVSYTHLDVYKRQP